MRSNTQLQNANTWKRIRHRSFSSSGVGVKGKVGGWGVCGSLQFGVRGWVVCVCEVCVLFGITE